MQKTLVLGALMSAFGLTMAQQVTDVTETVTQTNDVDAANTQQCVTAEELNRLLGEINTRLAKLDRLEAWMTSIAAEVEAQTPEEYKESQTFNYHDYVDLGITDANGKTLYWATCNVGAENPEDYGYYFAWGATTGCDNTTGTCSTHTFNWANAPFNGGNSDYSVSAWDAAKNTAVDANNNLLPAYDAATVNWGGSWRMPTYAEQTKLRTECYWQWVTSYNGKTVNGYVVYKAKATADKGKYPHYDSSTSSYVVPTPESTYSVTSDAHIFLPASGFRLDSSLYDDGSDGDYWSSSLLESYPVDAYGLSFDSSDVDWSGYYRYLGRSVRPVCVSSE